MTATVEAVLASIRQLPRPQQARRVAAWAREHRTAADFGEMVYALSRREPDGRRLALVAAGVGGRTDYLAAALHDYDPALWPRALRASRAVDDRVVARAVLSAPVRLRHQAYRIIRARSRRSLADMLVDRVREQWGDAEISLLLSACSPHQVARILPEIADLVDEWGPLFGRHPEVALDQFEARLARGGRLGEAQSTWPLIRATDTLPADRVIRILDRYERSELWQVWLPWHGRLYSLAKRDPVRAIEELTAEWGYGVIPARALHRILSWHDSASALLAWHVADSYHTAEGRYGLVQEMLRQMPWPVRESFFQAATAGRDLTDVEFPDTLLAVLPRARREREARRMLALPAVRDDRARTWALAAFLPLAQAAAVLLPATARPDGPDRVRAYELLIECAVRNGDPPEVLRAVGRLDRLHDEQDAAVRLAVVAALGRTRPRWGSAALLTAMFGDDLVPLLDEVARDAFLRRDGHRRHGQYGVDRNATIRRLDVLVANLLAQVGAGPPTLVEWLLRTAAWMAKRWADRDVGRLDRMLPSGLERQISDVLRPSLRAAVARRDTSLVCALGLTLRERVRKLPELTELLHETPATGGWRWTHQACVATDCLGRRCDLVPASWGRPDQPVAEPP